MEVAFLRSLDRDTGIDPASIERRPLLPLRERIDALQRELDLSLRIATARERRLCVELFEASRALQVATERAEAEAAAAAQARHESAEQGRRADWAADERARLARLYDDACTMATTIGRTIEQLEHETRTLLAAKDAEMHALAAAHADLEARFLAFVEDSVTEARAENERLSRLLNGVQQGRFWGLKRALQRARGLFRR